MEDQVQTLINESLETEIIYDKPYNMKDKIYLGYLFVMTLNYSDDSRFSTKINGKLGECLHHKYVTEYMISNYNLDQQISIISILSKEKILDVIIQLLNLLRLMNCYIDKRDSMRLLKEIISKNIVTVREILSHLIHYQCYYHTLDFLTELEIDLVEARKILNENKSNNIDNTAIYAIEYYINRLSVDGV